MNLEVLGVIEKYGITVVSLVVCAYFLYKVVMYSLVSLGKELKEEISSNRETIAKIGDMVNSMSDRHEDLLGNLKTLKEVMVDLVKEK